MKKAEGVIKHDIDVQKTLDKRYLNDKKEFFIKPLKTQLSSMKLAVKVQCKADELRFQLNVYKYLMETKAIKAAVNFY